MRQPLPPLPLADAPHAAANELFARDIRVTIRPAFLPQHSDPTDRSYVWAYRVRIHNRGERTVQLLRRSWRIIDSVGRARDVSGEGVVGMAPTLAPGEYHDYTSHCPLETPWGTMEGAYTFRVVKGEDAGTEFIVPVARFYLTPETAKRKRETHP